MMRFCYLLSLFAVLASMAVNSCKFCPFLDNCFREFPSKTKLHVFGHYVDFNNLNDFFVFLTFSFIFCGILLLNKPRKFKIDMALAIIICYCFYLGNHLMVFLLKFLFGDSNCNTKPNSVSGHFNFYVYFLLSLRHIFTAFKVFSVQNRNLKLKKNFSFWKLVMSSSHCCHF
ncbi:hypothetical protein MHBO_005311 [Bonamia ostreae]|uniref:Uncharacterized protein n=1 Tax=Bonamia ostreae TaxID=126728 RepID=A0ABV2AG14_9EUKA